MKTYLKNLIPAILAIGFCMGLPAYAEDTVIIDLQQEFSQRSKELGKKLEAFHDTPQARAETKQWAKEAHNAPTGSPERQLAQAKYVEARLAELGPRIKFLHDVRDSLPGLQTTIQRLGDALARQKTKLGLDDEAAMSGTLQKTKVQLKGMLVTIEQLGNDPVLANSTKYQELLRGFNNGVQNFAARRNGDAFNTKELEKLADSVDMSRLLIEEAWMRLEDDYNRLKFTNIRGNTSAVMAFAHKALAQLPGSLDDPASDEARSMDQEMYDTSGYEYDDMPAKGAKHDGNKIRDMIEKM